MDSHRKVGCDRPRCEARRAEERCTRASDRRVILQPVDGPCHVFQRSELGGGVHRRVDGRERQEAVSPAHRTLEKVLFIDEFEWERLCAVAGRDSRHESVEVCMKWHGYGIARGKANAGRRAAVALQFRSHFK